MFQNIMKKVLLPGQILSPLSAGLFRYAIAESGTAAMDAFITTSPLSLAQVKSSSLAAHYILSVILIGAGVLRNIHRMQ